MLPLPRITSISRPRSVLAVYSAPSAISTRACHVGSSYGSRAEQERSCHQKDQRKAGEETTKNRLLLRPVATPNYRGGRMSKRSSTVGCYANGSNSTGIYWGLSSPQNY